MDLYAYLVVLVVVLVFVLVLPLVSGTFSYKLASSGVKKGFGKTSSSSSKSKTGARFKIQLNHDGPNSVAESRSSTLRKRQGFAIDNDPNTFDYDLTELIEEDQRQEQREQELRFQRLAGHEQQNSELLV
ncbi:LAFA_0E20252g1_1 [Lachancea sp. 'fantastica']|nr:LAFA_0E20252g1_1 [Lachancea sp. 'fantastica']